MADAPLMVVNGAGAVTGWSRAAERRFGLATADALGLLLTDVLAGDTARADGGGTDDGGPAGGGPDDRDSGEGADARTGLRLEPLGGAGWAVREADGEDAGDPIDEALLDVLFTQERVRIHVLDPDLRLLRISDPSMDPDTDETARLRGRPFREVCAFDEPERVESRIQEVLRTGVPCVECLYRALPGDVAGGRRTLSLSAFRLQEGHRTRPGDHGAVLGVVVTVVDVTERVRHQVRDTALAAVRDRVGRTMDIEATCRDVVEAVVPEYADVGVVEIVDAVLRGESPQPGPLGRDVPLRRAAHGGGDDPAHPVGDVRAVPPGTPFQRALSDLRPRVVPVEDAPWAEADPARAHAIRESGAHTLLLAPLTLRGAVLGLVSLYRCGDSEPFTEADIPVALAMASRTALGIDNASRYVHEYTVASALQRRLLPQTPAPQPAVETDHLLIPGGGGGNWFDTIALPGARTALVVGEVGAEGIQAATTMGQLRTVVQALAALDLEADELLARLYDTAARLAKERSQLPESDPLHREPLMASCAYVVYDPFTGTCTAASAGHPAPLLVAPDGTVSTVGVIQGPPSAPRNAVRSRRSPSRSRRAACSRSTAGRCGTTPSSRRARCPRRSRTRTGRCGNCATRWPTPCPTRPSCGGRPCSWPGRTRCPRTGTPPGSCRTTGRRRPPHAASRHGRWPAGTWTTTPVTRPN